MSTIFTILYFLAGHIYVQSSIIILLHWDKYSVPPEALMEAVAASAVKTMENL